jgi:hypothetical protein
VRFSCVKSLLSSFEPGFALEKGKGMDVSASFEVEF